MKMSSEKAYKKDLERIDLSKKDENISEIKNISYIDDNDKLEH